MKREKLLMTLLAVKLGDASLNTEDEIVVELVKQGLVEKKKKSFKLTENGDYLVSLLNGAYNFFDTQKDIREEANEVFKKFKKRYNSFLDSIKMG